MDFVSRVFYFFTPYTDAREQAVGRFFRGLSEHGNRARTQKRLNRLLQRDIAVINLWTEYRYKGYRYLRKSQRRKLYTNLELIADDFERFYGANRRPATVKAQTTGDPEKLVLLQALMNYFSPRRGLYNYRDTSSFGRLLRDPTQEKLVGDCNQIVTLYIYLYSQYYEIRDLQARVLPGHVALHYNGLDIETTNGRFTNYASKKGSRLLPIEEIVSINLLDATDSYLSTHEVAAKDVLQASRLAFILSHDRAIVTRNLRAAYGKLINLLMGNSNYNKALTFAKASHDRELLGIVGHNGAIYEIGRHHYAAARRFARHAPKKDELIRNSWQSEGVYHYNARRYHDAIRAFKHTRDQTLIRQSYEALFFQEQAKLGPTITVESAKRHSRTIKRMRSYAKKAGNKKLIKYADSLLF